MKFFILFYLLLLFIIIIVFWVCFFFSQCGFGFSSFVFKENSPRLMCVALLVLIILGVNLVTHNKGL
jgi:hypothetical protein